MTKDELRQVVEAVRDVRARVEGQWKQASRIKDPHRKDLAAAVYHGQCAALREVAQELAWALLPEATYQRRIRFAAACLLGPKAGAFTHDTPGGEPGTEPPLPGRAVRRRKKP